MEFDPASRITLVTRLGLTDADRLTAGVAQSITAFVPGLGTVQDGGPENGQRFITTPFTLKLHQGGGDSLKSSEVQAPPVVCWIDPSTLGFFAMLRDGVSGGDPSGKTDSDLPTDPRSGFCLNGGHDEYQRRAADCGGRSLGTRGR